VAQSADRRENLAGNRVVSTSSERVTRVRALHSRSGRRKAGQFVVEGPQAVAAALGTGAQVHELLVDEEHSFADLVEDARTAGARITWVTPAVMTAMAETRQPQGILAICDLLPAGDLSAVMADAGPVVALESISDPGNVGTIIRTADSVSAAGVVLTPESADIHNGKVVRSTAGSLFHLPVLPGHSIDSIVTAARAAGRTVAVASADGGTSLFDAVDNRNLTDRTCWVIGSEAHGVSAEARALADVLVAIPMSGRAESLNAAVATAIVLYVTRHAESR
jgi:TrmH family RNA methyltransferase